MQFAIDALYSAFCGAFCVFVYMFLMRFAIIFGQLEKNTALMSQDVRLHFYFLLSPCPLCMFLHVVSWLQEAIFAICEVGDPVFEASCLGTQGSSASGSFSKQLSVLQIQNKTKLV